MAEETIPQMRERIDALEKKLATEQKAREKAEADVRLFSAKEVFRSAKLPEVQAELFVKTHEGDITPESVKEFATKFGVAPTEPVQKEATSEGTTTPATGTKLADMSRAGTGAGEGGAATAGDRPMSRQDWNALNQRDPAAALAVLRQGGVALRTDNVLAVRTP